MCEIIRAAVNYGSFSPITTDVTNIPFEILNYISCPGDEGESRICAVNGISYFKKDAWTIMLEGMNITVSLFIVVIFII